MQDISVHSDTASPLEPAAAGIAIGAWLPALALFVSFFPNPAIPIGNSTGLQFGTIAAALLLLARPRCLVSSAQGWLFNAAVLTIVISGMAVLVLNLSDAPRLVLLGTIVMTAALLPLGVAGTLASLPVRTFMRVLFAAVVIHAALSVYQWFRFQAGEFPFLYLYNNTSMLTVSDDYARWVRRPTGLFSEPSAMAATLGPWSAFALTYLSHARRHRVSPALILITVALVVGLIVGSYSGYSIWFLPAVAVLAVVHLTRITRRGEDPRHVLLAVAGALAVAGIAYAASEGALDRFNRASDMSWTIRIESIDAAVRALFQGPETLMFGVGAGNAPTAVADQLKFGANMWSLDHASVASITGRYVLETGMFGLLVLCVMGAFVIRRILASGERFSGMVCLVLWCVSVGITTGYIDTPPLWLALGWLSMWDRLFPRLPARRRIAHDHVTGWEAAA